MDVLGWRRLKLYLRDRLISYVRQFEQKDHKSGFPGTPPDALIPSTSCSAQENLRRILWWWKPHISTIPGGPTLLSRNAWIVFRTSQISTITSMEGTIRISTPAPTTPHASLQHAGAVAFPEY